MKPGAARTLLVQLAEPEPSTPQPGGDLALFRLAFRPLYLLAAAYAALAVPVWIAQFAGVLLPAATYPGMAWHAHEMTFGFLLAVIVGFLLTAARAWTGMDTPSGRHLAGLCAIWLAARVFNYTGPVEAAFVLDAAFIVAPMISIGIVLVRAHSQRNFFVLIVLTAFLAANTLFHLAAAGRLTFSPLEATRFFAFTVIALICVIGGRVIPTFTTNALRGIRQFRSQALDVAALAATLLALVLVLGNVRAVVTATACVLAAALQAARLAGWNPWATRGAPILWILHLSYAWIPIGLVLLALGAAGVLAPSAGLHALAVGAIGGMIVGMITRTALGHTGRALAAGRAEVAAYVLVQVAVVARLAPTLAESLPYLPWTIAAAVAWSLAFVVYLVKYAPMLATPRVDGRAG